MFLKRLKVIQTLLDVSIKVFVVLFLKDFNINNKVIYVVISMIYIAKVNEFNWWQKSGLLLKAK